MKVPLDTIARFFREKVGWHRVGIAVSICILAVAAIVLYETLKGIHFTQVVGAINAKRWQDVALSAFFVVAAYLTLTFYDFFALRTLDHSKVRYPTAALAAFTSYSIGHNVGASLLTGAAVRYRIYSSHGLDATDVAKVCFLAALTFWLGNAAMLGFGIAFEPEAATAIDQLSPIINRSAALFVLAALAVYLIWVWRAQRSIGVGKWRAKLPGGPLTLLQIAIGMLDLVFCAAAMYVLLPGRPSIEVVPLAVIFVSATLLGFASHSPGGLGVFEAAMLVALKQFEREELLAGLLLFRLLYYITPFILALILLGIREVLLRASGRKANLAQPVQPTMPLVSAIDSKAI